MVRFCHDKNSIRYKIIHPFIQITHFWNVHKWQSLTIIKLPIQPVSQYCQKTNSSINISLLQNQNKLAASFFAQHYEKKLTKNIRPTDILLVFSKCSQIY